MIVAMVAAGEGVSILPLLMVDPLRADVAVKPVEATSRCSESRQFAYLLRYLAPATAEFLSALDQAAKRRVDSWVRRDTRVPAA